MHYILGSLYNVVSFVPVVLTTPYKRDEDHVGEEEKRKEGNEMFARNSEVLALFDDDIDDFRKFDV